MRAREQRRLCADPPIAGPRTCRTKASTGESGMTANNRFGKLAQAAGKPCATETADQAGSSPASALLAMHDAAAGPVALHAAPHAASPVAAASNSAAAAASTRVAPHEQQQPAFPPLQLWGGCECTINRVGDQFFDQQRMNGGDERDDDMARVASLGIRTLRYPLLWEKIAPHGLAQADWRQSDERLAALRQRQIGVIAGLVHHGSGPAGTSLLDPGFGERLAVFADAVAARYPWIEDYTPVNEPLTTARFCGLYGVWYPHCKDDASFVRALLNQCRAVVLAMQAIRRHNPRARLVQTDDLGKTWSTPPLADVADFYNERRWLGWDLLCGKVDRGHPLWSWLLRAGARPQELLWFAQHRCPPDLIGVNYYITSERWLDHDPARRHRVRPALRRRRSGARHARAAAGHRTLAGRSLAALRLAHCRHRSPSRRGPRRPVALADRNLAERRGGARPRCRPARRHRLVAAGRLRLEQPGDPPGRLL